MFTKDELIAKARVVAAQFQLDPVLFLALIENESSWNPNAIRFEEKFYEHYEEKKDLPESEELNRSASFGLCQVLGETARWMGFVEDWLVLYDPDINLYLGAKYFRKCLERKEGKYYEGLLAYNGGSDLNYPYRVLKRMKHYLPVGSVEEDALVGG